MVQDRAIVTTADQQKVMWCVERIASFSVTLNDPKPRFQGQALSSGIDGVRGGTLNISELAKDTAIVSF